MNAARKENQKPANARALWRIEASGAVTAAGTRAWQSAASWVGGQRRFRRQPRPEIGNHPITLSACPEVTAGAVGTQRLARLLAVALADLINGRAPAPRTGPSATPAKGAPGVPKTLLLALPATLDATGVAEVWHLTRHALAEYGLGAAFADCACHPYPDGPIAGLKALQALCNVSAPSAPAILAGVDSLVDTERLKQDYASGRLMTGDNSNGWIPGEAAACVLLAPVQSTRAPTDRQWVLHRPAALESAEPHCAPGRAPDPDALARSLKGALDHAGWQGQHVGRILSDNDGSAWRAQAHASARLRASDSLEATD